MLIKSDYQIVAKDIVEKNPKIIGFSTWCFSYPSAILIAKAIKALSPELPVVFGGPQASILDEETMKEYPFIDFILKGEADESLIKLLKYILSNGKNHDISQIEGLTYRIPGKKKKIMHNGGYGFIENLDSLPIPSYERIFQKEHLRLDVGRGCPFKCTYCSTNQFFSKSYRVKSAIRIIKEIDYCRKKLDVNHFGFSHDMLTLDKKYINTLCETLIDHYNSRKIELTWSCSARTDCVTEEMLKAMWNSGCRAIFFGIESGSEKIQKQIKKNLDLKDAFRKISYATSLGMKVIVSYMAGFPGETAEDIDKTLRSVLLMAMAGAEPQMTLLSVLPGTPLYEQYIDKLEFDGKSFGFSGSSITGPVIDLVKTNRHLFSSFYFLPNKNLGRTELLFISNMVNLLIHFIPTIQSIKEYLESDISDFPLYHFIKKNTPVKSDKRLITERGLYFLTESFRQYLEYLTSRGLKEYIFDLFQADFTKAYMQVTYNKWQFIRSSVNKLSKTSNTISINNYMKVLPVWKIITTMYNIHHLANNHLTLLGKTQLKRGSYHYIVLPVSEKYCELIPVSGKYLVILENLRDMKVKKFIDYCKPVLDENGSRRLLKKLLRLGIVELTKNN